jgi:uncharacterized protein (DUF433 family)
MPAVMTENPTVVRTERGLSIKGTRITLYQILDYIHEGWPPKLIRDWHDLTDEQIDDVMAYITEHQEEVEAEYQEVVKQAEEIRRYWEERNRDRIKPIDPDTLSPERRALWEKHQEWKASLGIR